MRISKGRALSCLSFVAFAGSLLLSAMPLSAAPYLEPVFAPEWSPSPVDVSSLMEHAAQGDMEASFRLGMHHLFRKDCPAAYLHPVTHDRSHLEAIRDREQLSEATIPCDPGEAVRWLTPAAECGNLAAQYYLGYAYDGLEQTDKALGWYAVAASRGHPLGQIGFGIFFLGTRDPMVSRDYVEAYKWSFLAWEGGYRTKPPVHEGIAKRMSKSELQAAEDSIRAWKQLRSSDHPPSSWPNAFCDKGGGKGIPSGSQQ